MYLPLGSSILWRLFPLSFLLSSPDQPEQSLHHGHKDLNHLGNLSPYHDAPTISGVSADLPEDCTVDQVILLHRHGSRGPVKEEDYILQLVKTLESSKDAIRAAELPSRLEFLKQGYKYELVPEELTIVGRQQLFNHGIEFALRYPAFTTKEVVSTTFPRVIDSAHFFSQGFFGRGAENVTFLTNEDFGDPVPWLIPWRSCPKMSDAEATEVAEEWIEKYVPRIQRRLNTLIPGVEFGEDDFRGALYACPYDLAAHDRSPWCDVFTKDELRDLEYQFDLYLDHYSGHKSRGDPGPLVGAFYIKKLIERLTDTTEKAKRLHLEFAHEYTMLFPLATMGLNKDAEPLSSNVHHPPAHRKFRSSYQTPFAANMIWERFTCKESFEGPQVRLLLNGATFPLSMCRETRNDKRYGTCSLDRFVSANEYSTNVEYGSETWDATCGRNN